uniref:Putative secreted protein n=1 Tax=Anopheles marajoara TaxID=58244 RepID=A0A2M4CFB1_9DIPT
MQMRCCWWRSPQLVTSLLFYKTTIQPISAIVTHLGRGCWLNMKYGSFLKASEKEWHHQNHLWYSACEWST